VAENDPLEDIASLPVESQIAVTVSVLRSTRNTLARIEKKVDWVNRALWTLISTIVVGIVVYLVTSTHVSPTPKPSSASPQHNSASISQVIP
jgi:hypothetical protein